MQIDISLEGVTFRLAYNAAKERALVDQVASGFPVTPEVLRNLFPLLDSEIARFEKEHGQSVGKLYMTVTPDFADSMSKLRSQGYALLPETYFPDGYFRRGGSVLPGIDYALYRDINRTGTAGRLDQILQAADMVRAQVPPVPQDIFGQLEQKGYHIMQEHGSHSMEIARLMKKVMKYNDDYPDGITQKDIEGLFEDPTLVFYVCMKDNQLAGFATAYNNDVVEYMNGLSRYDFTLDTVVVDPEHRGKWLGRALTMRRIEVARESSKIYSTLAIVYENSAGMPDLSMGAHASLAAAGARVLGVSWKAYTFVSDLTVGSRRMSDSIVWGGK